MKLYLLSWDGWGVDFSVVRANSPEEAAKLAELRLGDRLEVLELHLDGPAEVVWRYEYSPDSRPDFD